MQVRKSYPSILQAVGIVLIIIVFMVLATIAVPVRGYEGETKNLLLLLRKVMALACAFFIIHRIRKKTSGISSYNFRPRSLWILVSAIASWMCLCVLMTIFIYLNPELEQSGYLAEDHRSDSVYLIIRTALISPFFEELLFRGIVLDGFLKKYSPTVAVIASSVLFGIMHIDLVQSVAAIFMGMLLGWFYWQTRSLFVSIFIHAFNNFIVTYPFKLDNEDQLLREAYPPVEYYSIYISALILFILSIFFIVRQARKFRKK